MTKTQLLTDPNSCLNKAADDEPVFLLRAKDPLAAMTVDYWCSFYAQQHGADGKCHSALEVAQEMRKWLKVHQAPTSDIGAQIEAGVEAPHGGNKPFEEDFPRGVKEINFNAEAGAETLTGRATQDPGPIDAPRDY